MIARHERDRGKADPDKFLATPLDRGQYRRIKELHPMFTAITPLS